MAYCTRDDIAREISEETMIELSDDAGAGIADGTVIAGAIADADAEIDAHCGVRYAVPFLPVPGIIVKLSQDIAIYNLHGRRPGMPENRKDRYTNAVKFLEQVAKGLVTLGAAAPDTAAGQDAVRVSAQDRVFTRQSLKGY